MSSRANYQEVISAVSDVLNSDIYVYFGDINADGADELCKFLRRRGTSSKKNVLLMLATYGGDPNAAYRMARRVQRTYGTLKRYKSKDDPRFYCFVPTICKSAGTLMALGADKIFIARDAEVGPIDIQLRKHDEVGERASGLLPAEALTALSGRARLAFLQHFRALRLDRELPFSTKLAAEVASTITVGLFKPIFEQLDPMRLAEMERSQRIASEYGRRLDVGNLRERALVRLLAEYPSHSFTIDSDETREIFKEVENADGDLEQLYDVVEGVFRNFLEGDAPLVLKLHPNDNENSDAENSRANDGRTGDEGPRSADGGNPGGTGSSGHPVSGSDDGGSQEGVESGPAANNDSNSEAPLARGA